MFQLRCKCKDWASQKAAKRALEVVMPSIFLYSAKALLSHHRPILLDNLHRANPMHICSLEAFQLLAQTKRIKEREGMKRQELCSALDMKK
jgi:hypothetical protein